MAPPLPYLAGRCLNSARGRGQAGLALYSGWRRLRSVKSQLYWPGYKAMDTTTRTPILSLKLSGTFLLRTAQRAFLESLFQEAPRTTGSCGLSPSTPYGVGSLSFFSQPPNSLPISLNMRAPCAYWPRLTSSRSRHRRHWTRSLARVTSARRSIGSGC